MARLKGTYKLGSNIEPEVSAPLDARTLVLTKADLTIAENFPYAYKGMVVSVQDEGKVYVLNGKDTTIEANWKLIGEGGSGGEEPFYIVPIRLTRTTPGASGWYVTQLGDKDYFNNVLIAARQAGKIVTLRIIDEEPKSSDVDGFLVPLEFCESSQEQSSWFIGSKFYSNDLDKGTGLIDPYAFVGCINSPTGEYTQLEWRTEQLATTEYVDERGLPVGGKEGQALFKTSNSDRDTGWDDVSNKIDKITNNQIDELFG